MEEALGDLVARLLARPMSCVHEYFEVYSERDLFSAWYARCARSLHSSA